MRILIIDDNPDDRLLELREALALFPEAEILQPTNLDDFEEVLAKEAPGLVLTDLDLRWTNGRQVLSTVKSRYPTCPVVMFTGTGDETIAVELMKEGLDDYVVKSPRQLPRLRNSIKIAVEMARSREALSDREVRLARALAQQQVIVRELHHRVKNNLQIVISLLYLRRRGADATTRMHFTELAGRVEALGAVQARIYESVELDRVDFRAALEDIAASLIKVYHGGQVTLTTNFEVPLVLEVSRAMPLSLICYEFILNAIKYAWPADAPGALTVEIIEADGTVEVRIADDGIGFDDHAVAKGMGRVLIRSLAEEAGVVVGVVTSPGSGTSVSLRLV